MWAGFCTNWTKSIAEMNQNISAGAGRAREGGVMRFEGLIALLCAAVVLCSLAVSTRPTEYETFSGFMAETPELLVSARRSAGLSARHTQMQLRSLEDKSTGLVDEEEKAGGSGGNEDQKMTPEQIDDKAKDWAKEHPEESKRVFM